jgi:hypothetical protein
MDVIKWIENDQTNVVILPRVKKSLLLRHMQHVSVADLLLAWFSKIEESHWCQSI